MIPSIICCYSVKYVLLRFESFLFEKNNSKAFLTGCAGFPCCKIWIHKKRWRSCLSPEFCAMCWDAHSSHWASICILLQGICWLQCPSFWWFQGKPSSCYEIQRLLSWHCTPGKLVLASQCKTCAQSLYLNFQISVWTFFRLTVFSHVAVCTYISWICALQ